MAIIEFIYNPRNHTDEENLQYCWLRANEWGDWMMFISQPIAPFLLLYFPWWKIIIGIILSSWLWSMIRYKFISSLLADIAVLFVHFKWPISIGIGIYFLFKSAYYNAIISILWPLITLLLMTLTPTTKIGVLQDLFMKSFGYFKKIE
ncbi:MAG: hypothetical protein ACHQQQ_05685 [Bacteroidota bacterium]